MDFKKHLPLALATLAVIATMIFCTHQIVSELTDMERVLFGIEAHTDTR